MTAAIAALSWGSYSVVALLALGRWVNGQRPTDESSKEMVDKL